MSTRPPRRLARNALLALGGVVAIFVGIAWLRELARLDPFAGYRRTPEMMGLHTAVVLDDVQFWNYQGGELTANGSVDRVNVRDDRQFFEFLGVRDSRYRAKEGTFAFDAPHATWNSITHQLEVDRGVHVMNDKMNLRAASFTYDEKTAKLTVPGAIKGRLYEGDVEADGLVYAMEEESYTTGPAVWEGKTHSPLDEIQGESKPTNWKFDTKGVTSHKGEVQTMLDAQATDGEVIVKAEKLERNVKTDVVIATGKVHYYSAKANLVCDKAVVYRKEKRAVLTGNVDMLVKPKDQQKLVEEEIPPFRPMVPDEVAKDRPSPPAVQKSEAEKQMDDEVRASSSARRYPVSITAARIEYWYGEGNRHAVVTGSPQAMQQIDAKRWRYVWADSALYDGEKERLRMLASEGKDDLRVKTSLGDDVTAQWFDISTKENEDDWQALGLKGVLYPDEDEVPKTGGQPPPLQGPIGGKRPPPR
ncbi:MAG: hypothetical protein M9921_05595 [Fimbriimonadaceae bacterium]|nr:hypothetical protein [Fimbriimonadaceae bacterium]